MARTFSVPIIGQSAASGAQVIDGSLKFDDTEKNHLLRTHTAGNTKTFTWAGWVKRDKYGGYQTLFGHVSGGSGQHYIDFGSDKIRFTRYVSSNEAALETTAVFRDTGWYHIVCVWDTTNSTANDRLRIYVNGEQITDFSTRVNPSQNYSGVINTAIQHGICRIPTLDQNYNACRMSQVYFMDGLALEPENFGFTDPLTNIWKPKKYLGDFNGPADLKSEDGSFSATGNQVGGPIANAYDGNIGEQDGSTSGVTFWGRSGGTATQSGLSIPVTSTVKIRYNVNVSGGSITVNSVSKDANVPGGGNTSLETLEWDAFSVGYSISSIAITSPNLGVGVYVSGIIVDGVVLEDIPAGTNGFYLPMDGVTPIGQDESGNRNDWTPTNFGGSVALDSSLVSGARPILNTTQGGSQAGVGVFGSKENKYYTVTTANGSVYQFDITSGDNPSLEFIRGATYRFDYSSHTSHPLLFSSSNPDSSTTAYIKGTSIASNVISFTVPHDAPDTLYYYCSNHPTSMNGAISITTDNTKADQFASNCVLALPLVGSAGDVSASIACTSSTKALTTNGNAAAASESSNFYSGSFEFDGTDDDVRYTSPGAIGTGDFTLECWVNFDVLNTNQGVVDTRSDSNTNGFALLGRSDGTVSMADGTALIGDAISASTGRWIHLAGSRSGSSLKFFVDGKLSSTVTNSTNFSNDRLIVGTIGGGTEDLNGYVQDVRLYKGVAKYTSDFVVPSTSPDILPDTPSGVSGSSKLAKITDGAVTFDGSGDYLLGGTSSDYNLGTGDFTIEGYIYPTNASGTQGIMGIGNAVSPACQIFYNVSNSQKVRFNVTDGTAIESTGTAPVNAWSHFAVVREGTGSNETKIYINGELEAQGTISTNLTETTLQIGRPNTSSGTEYFNGFISNFRVIKGTALYTKNFTPPSAPLTNVTNTKLLCCQSNTLAGSATVAPTISGLNDGTVWSSGSTTGSVYASDNDWNNVFNGVAGNDKAIAANDATYEITLPGGGISGVTKVEIYGQQQAGAANATITLSSAGEQSVAQGTSLGYTTFYTGSSDTLTKLKVASTSSNRSSINAVRINDTTILTDPLANSVGASPDVAATTFNPFNTDINTVRGQETGYSTVNPLANGGLTLSNGNLDVTGSGDTQKSAYTTFAVDSGKWYFEFLVKQTTSGNIAAGVANVGNFSLSTQLGATSTSWSVIAGGSTTVYKYHNSSVSSIGSYSAGTIINIAFDVDGGNIWFGINGNYVDGGNPYTGDSPVYSNLTGTLYPMVNGYGTSDKMSLNFGQKPFKFPPPAGFQPLNAANVRPTKVISRPDQYVGVATYIGNSTGQSINMGFKPDFLWIKSRTNTGSHAIQDSVRGSAKQLQSNTTNAESTNSATAGVLSFNSNGFLLGTESSATGSTNGSQSYVAWGWKAGGNKNTFNVDDVGYASASDVGMSVGGLNSAGYNTSDTWSDDISGTAYSGSYPVTYAFDGDLSTTTMSNDGGTLTWTPSTPVTGNTIRLYIYAETSGGTPTFKINGVTQTIPFNSSSYSSGWLTYGGTTINEVIWQRNSGTAQVRLAAVEVDGKILVDSGVTPPTTPSIAATGCSVGTKQGFSIIKWQGDGSDANRTVPHGLLEAPSFIIVKALNEASRHWLIWHKDYNDDDAAMLFTTGVPAGSRFGPYAPTSSVFGVYGGQGNRGTTDFIGYSWHDVPGLQKFGKYKGNSSNDGPFVELGFRPSVLLIKRYDDAGNWILVDNERNKVNVVDKQLIPNSSGADYTEAAIDFVSNGFKVRLGSSGHVNIYDFYYAAWAEAPTVDLYGGGANAR